MGSWGANTRYSRVVTKSVLLYLSSVCCVHPHTHGPEGPSEAGRKFSVPQRASLLGVQRVSPSVQDGRPALGGVRGGIWPWCSLEAVLWRVGPSVEPQGLVWVGFG